MAGNEEVKIKIKTALDALGAEQAKKVLKEVQAEAEGAGSKGKAGLDRFRDSTGGVTAAMKALRSVMAGLGIAGFISSLAVGVRKIDEFISAKKRMTEEIQKQNDASAAQRLLEIYEKIKGAIKQANEELAYTNELEDKRLANARKLEDANLRLAEEKEIEALSADDPDRGLKEKAIRARYAQRRGQLEGAREEEDIGRDAARKEQAAAEDQKAIDELSSVIKELTAAMKEQQERGAKAQGMAGRTSSHILGRSSGYQSLADSHRANTDAIFGQIKDAYGQIGEREKSRDRNRAEAGVAREALQAVGADAKATEIASARNVGAADEGIAKAERDRVAAKEAAAEKKRIEKNLAKLQERVNQAQLDEAEKKSDLDAFDKRTKGTTNTRQRDAARAPLEQAWKDSAQTRQTFEREFAQYLAANKDYMREATTLIRSAKKEIDKQNSRLAAGSCDASGD